VENYNIYRQITERTQGDIYIGVVGPVRTGKSTFIKRFMDLLVIPNIENEYTRERAQDELPQSANGRTIMTTEPKFVPDEAVNITIDENVNMKVKLVDCVGYLVKGAIGYMEDNAPRMVSTPWLEKQIPFEEAAELGTKKVINEHSTIGLVVTTDGSITEINRDDYVEAEERVIKELKQINKPFVMILNSINPQDEYTIGLKKELEEKYSVPVLSVNCARMELEDINKIMEHILYEFPIREIGINIPKWVEALENDHWLNVDITDTIKNIFKDAGKIREAKDRIGGFKDCKYVETADIENINLGDGSIVIRIETQEGLFYRVLSEITGLEIDGEDKIVAFMSDLSKIKREYEKVEYALHEVKVKGYGIVTPSINELTLDEPEIIKHGGRFGVRLRASAPSIHMDYNKSIFKFIRKNNNKGQKPYEITYQTAIGFSY
jgi:stage IV sporulation protein A